VAEWRERISARAALCAWMAPRGETKKHPQRAGTKLSRRVRQKWSRRDGSLTIDIRGVDPPLGVPPVSGYPARTSCTKGAAHASKRCLCPGRDTFGSSPRSKVENHRLAILTLDCGTLDQTPGRDTLFHRAYRGEFGSLPPRPSWLTFIRQSGVARAKSGTDSNDTPGGQVKREGGKRLAGGSGLLNSLGS
jgi:hypothetical protein